MYRKCLSALATLSIPAMGFCSPYWETSQSQSFVVPTLNDNTAALVFVRPKLSMDADSSTNIGVNDRFLVSLQDGHYGSVVVCAGTVSLSAIPTKAYTNDLSQNALMMNLPAGHTQYVVVDVDEQYQPTLRPISDTEADELMSIAQKQTHQLSRSYTQPC